MKVKLFTANTMQEAVAQVKNDLGRDAVILHTRRFRKGGILGFFAKDMVEVMAALDSPAIVSPTSITSQAAVPIIPVSPPAEKSITKAVRSVDEDTKMTAIHLELASMRKTIEQLTHKLPTTEKSISPLFDLLIQNEIEEEIANNLLQGLTIDEPCIGEDSPVMLQLLSNRISNYLQKVEGIRVAPQGCKTVAFIGPTGVGKTTTIAKLAANFAVRDGYKIALVTADTYRIAAVEQLKTYADIIGVPIEIVYTNDELKAALYRHKDKQLILLDTAGRSPKNQYHLSELQSLLASEPNIETHLVLSTTTKYSDALDIVNRFSLCAPQKLLFTKIDEATKLGTIFNLLYKFPTTLSYVTTGQNVPEDIELANPSKLASLILRDWS